MTIELTKDQIKNLKTEKAYNLPNLFLDNTKPKEVLFILQNLGHLSTNFDDSCILPLVSDKNQKIRLWSIKTLGKTKKIKNLRVLEKVAYQDESTEVRREAISSIGRIKDKVIIPILIKFLNDDDPKIVLQAIRGLLTFRNEPKVCHVLKKCAIHPNETVQKVIEKEFLLENKAMPKKQNHSKSYSFLKNVVVLGDVRKTLKYVPDESFHLTFTSPPYYNARDYSIYKSYREYLDFLEEVFSLTHKKTKEGSFPRQFMQTSHRILFLQK